MIENWRDVPGFEGKYQITIDTPEGRCRSLNYRGTRKVRELSNNPNKCGYIFWRLREDGKQNNQQAAVWIALTFPELVQNEYFDGAEIDHIDTNRLNNHPSNLRWVSHKENLNNPLTRIHKSETRPNRKWVIKLSLKNEILHFYPSTHQAARETGIYQTNISKCCLGKIKSAGGFIWKYSN